MGFPSTRARKTFFTFVLPTLALMDKVYVGFSLREVKGY